MSVVQALTVRRLHPLRDFSWPQQEFNRIGGGPLFTKPVVGHFGCVNALEFSNGSGELLASGGDDRAVAIWKVDSILRNEKPSHVRMKGEHQSNIFALAFDSTNRHVLSGGNDEQVIVHDVETREAQDVLMFTEPIYCIAAHPSHESLFGTACEDGTVCLFDRRSNGAPTIIVEQRASMHSLAFNEAEPRLLASANKRCGLCLWDIRMPKRKLLRYGSVQTRSQPTQGAEGAGSQPSGPLRRRFVQRALERDVHRSYMSVRFSRDGQRVLGLRRRLPVALFDTASPRLVAEFDAPSYLNSCTMKSCCFGGLRDQFVVAGSDDFGVYLWQIPPASAALDNPMQVCEPHTVLRGHRSIVNQVRFSAANQLLVSSGVEKVLRVWTPFATSGAVHSGGTFQADYEAQLPTVARACSTASATSAQRYVELQTAEWLRPLATHEDYIRMMNEMDDRAETVAEDTHMLAFFDMLIRRELDESAVDSSDELDSLSSSSVSLTASHSLVSTSVSSTSSDDSNSDGNRRKRATSRHADSGAATAERNELSTCSASLRRYLRLRRRLADLGDRNADSSAEESASDTDRLQHGVDRDDAIDENRPIRSAIADFERAFDDTIDSIPQSSSISLSSSSAPSIDEYGSIDHVAVPCVTTQQSEASTSSPNAALKRKGATAAASDAKRARAGSEEAVADTRNSSNESAAGSVSVSSSDGHPYLDLESESGDVVVHLSAASSNEDSQHEIFIDSGSDSDSDSVASLSRWALAKLVQSATDSASDTDVTADADARQGDSQNTPFSEAGATAADQLNERTTEYNSNSLDGSLSNRPTCTETRQNADQNVSRHTDVLKPDREAQTPHERVAARQHERATDSSDLFGNARREERLDRIRSWTSLSNLYAAHQASSGNSGAPRQAAITRETVVDLILAAKRRWHTRRALLTTSNQVGNVRLRGESVLLAAEQPNTSKTHDGTQVSNSQPEGAESQVSQTKQTDDSAAATQPIVSDSGLSTADRASNEHGEAVSNADDIVDLAESATLHDGSNWTQQRNSAASLARIAELKRLRMRLLNDPDQS